MKFVKCVEIPASEVRVGQKLWCGPVVRDVVGTLNFNTLAPQVWFHLSDGSHREFPVSSPVRLEFLVR